ncbi:MAG: pyridoxal phosphate-dependent aminotransferase, partial [Lachnospiraceae bacterium]|nr:pyridoxal phosphate-dependent aminotransferase [Lachnospiraceae bacterium]
AFCPYFGEYKGYTQNFGGTLVECRSNLETFQPDMDDLKAKITEKTKAVIINTPNNPTGVIYTDESLKALADVLLNKEKEYSHEIYLISDEPYRELVYDGNKEKFLTGFYHNTLVGYSFSKSLSLPGERIGYIAVPNAVTDYDDMMNGLEINTRQLGFVNAPSLMQKAVALSIDEKTDVAYYDKNRRLLYESLSKMGYTCIKPDGAFYMWVKSPMPDEEEFVNAAKKHHILMVKGSAFACPGFVRLAYCTSYETIERSLPAFEALAKELNLK